MADPKVLLDSNICIYLLEGLSEPARDRVQGFAPGEVATSTIAYAEVLRGVPRGDARARRKVDALFRVIEILPFDAAAAEAYAALPFKRRSFDRLIAAHALSLGLPVATNNEGDFADVPNLRVENWTLPL